MRHTHYHLLTHLDHLGSATSTHSRETAHVLRTSSAHCGAADTRVCATSCMLCVEVVHVCRWCRRLSQLCCLWHNYYCHSLKASFPTHLAFAHLHGTIECQRPIGLCHLHLPALCVPGFMYVSVRVAQVTGDIMMMMYVVPSLSCGHAYPCVHQHQLPV